MVYEFRGPTPREYQKNIAERVIQGNTLVVLPTGMGKTLIGILVSLNRFKIHPESKALIIAPTRPLAAQHKKSFENFTSINSEEIILLTGKVRPEERIELYKKGKIIIATPQTIEHDITSGRMSLENFSFLIVDESHRSVKRYAYPIVAKKYMLQSKYPLILGLTASPGGTHEKIEDICDNLFIKSVEVRTESDTDMKEYIQPVQKETIYVDFPIEFQKIKDYLEQVLNDDLYWLRDHHYTFTYKPTKRMLLDLQNKVIGNYTRTKNYGAFWAMLRTAGAIKIKHAIELLETQGIKFLTEFLRKLKDSKKKTDSRLMSDARLLEALSITEKLNDVGVEHPKLLRVIELVQNLVTEKTNSRIMIFANFRSTVSRINELLNAKGIRSEILIGQTIKDGRGLSQKQQIEILNEFNQGLFNVMICSSIGEEGIDIKEVDAVIFYDSVPTEIRKIQRTGRTGRTAPGKVFYMITKGTADEIYFWSSLHKERKMKNILHDMKGKEFKKRKISLMDWSE
jgi:Fanconi anemia group M protein